MLEFPGQVLELSMPVGPRGPLSHLWVQAWADNDYQNLRALFILLAFLIVWELSGVRLSVQLSLCKHFLLSHLSKTTGRLCWKLGQNVPLSVVLCKYQKEFRSVDKHGRRRLSLIFLVIASPQKVQGGFERNLPIRLASMSSCACTKPNSGRSTNFTFLAPVRT